MTSYQKSENYDVMFNFFNCVINPETATSNQEVFDPKNKSIQKSVIRRSTSNYSELQ